jgi:hypothetical protein
MWKKAIDRRIIDRRLGGMTPRLKLHCGLAIGLSVFLHASAAEQPTSPVNQSPNGGLPAISAQATIPPMQLPVKVTESGGRVAVEIGGQPFTEYHFKDAPRPYCYPVLGAGGTPMTRNYPMKDVPGEDRDHPHHRGMWLGHQNVNGQNFWTEAPGNGKIVHQRFLRLAGGKVGEITSENEWIGGDGEAVCSDVRTLRFSGDGRAKIVDWDITLKATHGDVVFGDDKDGFMAVRVAESMRALKPAVKGQKPQPGGGHIVMSTGVRDDGESVVAAKLAKREAQTWGKRADWVYYYGPVDGKTVGIAILDNPANPRHPTWWHVRDYGLFAANPFGQHFFENKPTEKHLGDFKIPAGGSATFRYRVVFTEGDEKAAGIAQLDEDYVKATSKK